MAGHSKWTNTKYRKAAQDTRRGKIFTKIIRALVMAAKLGGDDPDSNPRLRAEIEKALASNMPRDTIYRAIARGIGGGDAPNMESITYEGYGPGGTAIMIECLSDNRNRTVGEVRHAFTKCGGNLSTDGSVSYLFTKKGVITYAAGIDEALLMEVALEAGAKDIISYNNVIDVHTAWESLWILKDILAQAGYNAETAKILILPLSKINMNTKTALKLLHLINILEHCEDVHEVYHNGEIPHEITHIL